MKLVIQFFNEKDGTRSDSLSGSPGQLIQAFDEIESRFLHERDIARDRLDQPIVPVGERPEEEIREALELIAKQADDALDSFVDSFVIVILEQVTDDPDDMRVSQIPILKRENFIKVLKEKV